MLALDGMQIGHNRMPLTWATRSEKAQSLISWTVCEQHPQGDLGTSKSILEFWTLDLRDWAAHLRSNSRAELPQLYERPYVQFGEYLVQIPWLGAFRNTSNAAINQLRLTSTRRSGLRDETRSIEEHLGQVLRDRGFSVVMNYHPPRPDGEEDAGEVDVICQRDGHLFIIEVKSTYVRKNFREAWQHKYQTLRRAGLQVKKKHAAVVAVLRSDRSLSGHLGMPFQEAPAAIHGWIVDTSIEHDHEYFSGHLKVSLEEILIVLRNERHVLLGLTEETSDADLYPDGFSAGRFAAIVEGNELWSMLTPAPRSGDQESLADV
jgi:Holliday junction resolvase-like predicted endonuclease